MRSLSTHHFISDATPLPSIWKQHSDEVKLLFLLLIYMKLSRIYLVHRVSYPTSASDNGDTGTVYLACPEQFISSFILGFKCHRELANVSKCRVRFVLVAVYVILYRQTWETVGVIGRRLWREQKSNTRNIPYQQHNHHARTSSLVHLRLS